MKFNSVLPFYQTRYFNSNISKNQKNILFLIYQIGITSIVENKISFFERRDLFSDLVSTFDLNGEITLSQIYKEGELVKSKDHTIQAVFAMDDFDSDGQWILAYTDHYIDWYQSDGYGGLSFTDSQYVNTTSEWVWVPNGNSSQNWMCAHSEQVGPGGGEVPIMEVEMPRNTPQMNTWQ